MCGRALGARQDEWDYRLIWHSDGIHYYTTYIAYAVIHCANNAGFYSTSLQSLMTFSGSSDPLAIVLPSGDT